MTDVRLTATNPEDSSVVPVACNAKGELKLEELPDASFDGNLDGNLLVSGSGMFGDLLLVGTIDSGCCLFSDGGVSFGGSEGVTIDGRTGNLSGPGKAQFAMQIDVGSPNFHQATNGLTVIHDADRDDGGSCGVAIFNQATGWDKQTIGVYGPGSNNLVVQVNNDGSAEFAGGQAGFTAEGNFWCTTRRGDTVILDATSNGMGIWESYTPTKRRQQIAKEWAEKNVVRPKPEETSQD